MAATAIERLSHITPKDYFIGTIKSDYGLSQVEAQALYEFNHQFRDLYQSPNRKPGQIILSTVAIGEPAGKPIKECKLVPTIVTFTDDEDLEVLQLYGVPGLRRYRILRVSVETLEQGGLTTQEQLAFMNTCDRSTVVRDIKALRELGLEVPTRGYIQDIGPGISHKVRAVDLYLEGLECSEIGRRMYHAPTSIFRYLEMFIRVYLLSEDGYSPEEIRHIARISPKLCTEYLALVEKHKTVSPNRLAELRERYGPPLRNDIMKKGGLP